MQGWLLIFHQSIKDFYGASAGLLQWFKFSLRNSALQIVDQKKVCSQHIPPLLVGFMVDGKRNLLVSMKKNGIYWKFIRWLTEIEGKPKQPSFKRAGTRMLKGPQSKSISWEIEMVGFQLSLSYMAFLQIQILGSEIPIRSS